MTVNAMCLRCCSGCVGIAKHQVLATSHRFQVLRVDASTIAATVMDEQSVRDRAYELLVRPTMSALLALLLAPGSELRVSIAINRPEPDPARRLKAAILLRASKEERFSIIPGWPVAARRGKFLLTQGDSPWVMSPAVASGAGTLCDVNCLTHLGLRRRLETSRNAHGTTRIEALLSDAQSRQHVLLEHQP
jgi:hypothetical protein